MPYRRSWLWMRLASADGYAVVYGLGPICYKAGKESPASEGHEVFGRHVVVSGGDRGETDKRVFVCRQYDITEDSW